MASRLLSLVLLVICLFLSRWPTAVSITTKPKNGDDKNSSSLLGEDEEDAGGRRLGGGSGSCTRRIAEAAAVALGNGRSESGSGGWRSGVYLSGLGVRAPLRTAPYDMHVTDIRLRSPTRPQHNSLWLRVDRCSYDPSAHALQTRLLFTDFAVTGSVKLFDDQSVLQKRPPALDYQDDALSTTNYHINNNINNHFGHQFNQPHHHQEEAGPEAAVGCNMTLRMRKAGIGFTVVPTSQPHKYNRRRPPQLDIATSTTFLEPQFISVHAYGCKSPGLTKWEDDDSGSNEDWTEARLEVTREMEEVFLRGVRSLLTKFIEARLEPALKDALMLNLGYTLSYGKR